jgi:uncharacterized protein YbjT (DUF2867 family)
VILVTGANGFVGGHVVHLLREQNREVRCLVRDRRKAERLESWGCQVVEGDMTDASSLRRAVEGADVVVHLVAIRQGKPEEFQRIMVGGTRDLLAVAKEAGVQRFVLMSALGASEETKGAVPYYGAKWQEEQDVQQSGLPYVIFRPSFIFAPDGGILPTFRKLARIAPVTPIVGPGKQRIQPIWADDVATYFADAVARDDVTGHVYELGGPDAVTWNELWARLKRTLGQRRPSVHVPMAVMRANALITERLPGNIPLTRDLLKMLEHADNVPANDEAVRTFQVSLLPLDDQLRRAV